MKTNVLSIRLPEDKAEILQKMADSRGLKVSDLVKEMVLAGIAGSQSSSGDNRLVLTKLEQVEANPNASSIQWGIKGAEMTLVSHDKFMKSGQVMTDDALVFLARPN